ncbi:hypothetical protein A4A49_58104, partial [Nicotiana attenuata]
DGANGINANGIGGAIRNSRGEWILGFAQVIQKGSTISTELYALLKGLTLALQHHLMPIEVELDAKQIITLLQTDNFSHSNMINDCRYLLNQLNNPPVRHAYREQNMVADQLAKAAKLFVHMTDPYVYNVAPPFVNQALEA